MFLLFKSNSAQLHHFPVEPTTNGAALRQRIAEVNACETPDAFHMSCCGRLIADEDQLMTLGLTENAEVSIVGDVDGSGKGKKKKKQYTTAKHVPHKRKKVKMAVLKYYRINDDKIDKIRMHCVSPTCGRSIFMAAHHNRTHCGKCGMTLIKGAN